MYLGTSHVNIFIQTCWNGGEISRCFYLEFLRCRFSSKGPLSRCSSWSIWTWLFVILAQVAGENTLLIWPCSEESPSFFARFFVLFWTWLPSEESLLPSSVDLLRLRQLGAGVRDISSSEFCFLVAPRSPSASSRFALLSVLPWFSLFLATD